MASTANRVGYWAGLAAFGAVLAYDVVQGLQVAGWLRFPLDEILIYGTSQCIVVPFLLEMIALHQLTRRDQQLWTHAALIAAVIYAVFVTANYAVQLATVIPAKAHGLPESMRVLEQTPHSMFWDFDAVGYIAMGFAALFSLPALGRTGVEGRARWALIAHVLSTPLICVVYFYPVYSTRLLMLGALWGVTAPLFMLMLARALRVRPAEVG